MLGRPVIAGPRSQTKSLEIDDDDTRNRLVVSMSVMVMTGVWSLTPGGDRDQ